MQRSLSFNRTILSALLLALVGLTFMVIQFVIRVQQEQVFAESQATQQPLLLAQATQTTIIQKTRLAVASRETVTAEISLYRTQLSGEQQATAQTLRKTQVAGNLIRATENILLMSVTEEAIRGEIMSAEATIRAGKVAIAVQETVAALPTQTPFPTQTPIPTMKPSPLPTATSVLPKINLIVEGCNTGIQMVSGEVTNVLVRIHNVGRVDVSNVEIMLSASDESKYNHPDKAQILQYLPVDYAERLWLTVDTAFWQDTSIEVTLTATFDVKETARKSGCPKIDPELLEAAANLRTIIVPRLRLR